eukprot:Nk52_evm53s151 gene=Nk52_evmTU53s151
MEINRDLIDPDFEGYKLDAACEAAGVDEIESPYRAFEIEEVEKASSVGYHYVQLVALHNALHEDPFNSNLVFYFDVKLNIICCKDGNHEEGHIVRMVYDIAWDGRENVIGKMFKEGIASRLYPSVSLFCKNRALAAFGCSSSIVLFDTGDRSNLPSPFEMKWIKMRRFQPSLKLFQSPFTIVDAKQKGIGNHGGDHSISVAILQLWDAGGSNSNGSSRGSLTTVLDISMSAPTKNTSDNLEFSVASLKSDFRNSQVPYVCQLLGAGESILFCSASTFDNVVVANSKEVDKEKYTNGPAPCVWSQTLESLTIAVPFDPSLNANSVRVSLDNTSVKVFSKEISILEEDLFGKIDVDGSNWRTEGNVVFLELQKLEKSGRWYSAFSSLTLDETMTDDLVNDAHKMLGKWTTDGGVDLNASAMATTGMKRGLFSEMEQCDFQDEACPDFYLFETCNGTLKECIPNDVGPWLCKNSRQNELSFCLQRDVDALCYTASRSESGKMCLNHTCTFDALSYIQSSKREKKFLSFKDSTSEWFILADSKKRVYVYKKRKPSNHESSHFIIDVGSGTQILGLVVSSTRIVLLSTNAIFTVSLPSTHSK